MKKAAVDIKKIDEVLRELFEPVKGGSALERYSRVRHTLYEIQLWREYKLPITEIPKAEKRYFCERFLKKPLSKASETEIEEAITKLNYAAIACQKKCTTLVKNFNKAVEGYNTHALVLEEIHSVEGFLDFFTFWYDIRTDHEGKHILEKPYGFEIRVFSDKRNRSDIWFFLKRMLEEGRVASMQNLCRLSDLFYAGSIKIII